MRKLLVIAILVLVQSASAKDSRPNILLIIADQHSGSVLTQRDYPYINTPGIDEIANQGVTFTRAYTTFPVCQSFRKSFITGKMPSKIVDTTQHQSIGTALKDSGYKTAYHGKWHVGSTSIRKDRDWHGFDEYDGATNDTKTMSRSVNFIKSKHEKPFFMITSYMNPHDTCELARNMSGIKDDYKDMPVEENVDLSLAPPLPTNFGIPALEPEGFSTRRGSERGDRLFKTHPTKDWDEDRWRQYMYGYDRLVEMVDGHIKKLVDALDEQGILENTVVIYTSDHGDGHASHMWNQKMTFYEEAINIPFIVSWKGQTKAGLIDKNTLISNGLDLYPTILKFAGVDVPATLYGQDVGPQVMLKHSDKNHNGTPYEPRDYVVSELVQKNYKSKGKGKDMNGRMVVSANFKYILFDKGENREQLFDRVIDPGEMKPVTYDPAYQSQLIRHRAMLSDWHKKTSDNDFNPNGKFPTLKTD